MKSLQIVWMLAVLASFVGCKESFKPGQKEFGEKFVAANVISVDSLFKVFPKEGEFPATVEGTVKAVCQAKGCWMTLEAADKSNTNEIFVNFNDHGFFMPPDIAGKQVVMTGKAFKEVTSVDDLKHYAEDEGLSKEEIEKITEPKEEFKFMATGVQLK